jgi:superfamily I DNA and RNA helicase
MTSEEVMQDYCKSNHLFASATISKRDVRMMRREDQVNEILVLFNIEILKYHYVFRYSSWIEGEMNSEEREGYLSFDG